MCIAVQSCAFFGVLDAAGICIVARVLLKRGRYDFALSHHSLRLKVQIETRRIHWFPQSIINLQPALEKKLGHYH
jgi:hypothetical protein